MSLDFISYLLHLLPFFSFFVSPLSTSSHSFFLFSLFRFFIILGRILSKIALGGAMQTSAHICELKLNNAQTAHKHLSTRPTNQKGVVCVECRKARARLLVGQLINCYLIR